jgi:uncharacterized delta-60 repeat protein
VFIPNWRMVLGCARGSKVNRAIGAVMEQMEERTLLSAGMLDGTFGNAGVSRFSLPGTATAAQEAAVEVGGKLIAAGESDGHILLSRYDSAGNIDAQLVWPGLNHVQVSGLAIDGSRLLVSGSVSVAHTSQTGAKTEYQELVVAGFAIPGASDTSFTLDTTFGAQSGYTLVDLGANSPSAGIAANGAHIILGATAFSPDRGTRDFAVAALTHSGTLDTAFGSAGVATADILASDSAAGVAIDSTGRIIVAGASGDSTANHIAAVRFSPSGALDTSFAAAGKLLAGTTGADVGTGVAIDTGSLANQDKVLLTAATGLDLNVLRFNVDGSADTTFGAGGVVSRSVADAGVEGKGISVDAAGGIVVGVNIFPATTAQSAGFMRLGANGEVVNEITQVGPDGSVARAVLAAATGDYLVGFTPDQPGLDLLAAKLGSSTTVTPLVGAQNVIASATYFEPNGGSVLVAGTTNVVGGVAVTVAKSNGVAGAGWQWAGLSVVPGALSLNITSVMEESDGSVLAGGFDFDGDGISHLVLAHFNPNGTPDTGFGAGGVVVDADAGELAFGGAVVPGGVALAGINANGDATLFSFTTSGDRNPAGDVNVAPGAILTAVLVTNTNIYVGGIGFDGSSLVAELGLDGSPIGTPAYAIPMDTVWQFVGGLALTPDGGIVAAGQTAATVGGDMALALFAAAPGGGFASGETVAIPVSYPPDTFYAGQANAVTIDDQGRIILTGILSIPTSGDPADSANQPINRREIAVARRNADGTPDTSFGADGLTITNLDSISASEDFAYGVAIDPATGRILVAGSSDGAFVLVGYQGEPVVVANQPPLVDPLTSATVDEGSPTLHFSGAFTDASPAGATFEWKLSLNAGPATVVSTTQSFDFNPIDNGIYVLTFKVTDAGFLSASQSATITVNNVAPTPAISGNSSGVTGASLSFSASATDPGINDHSTFAWTVTGPASVTPGNGPTFSFTPTVAGTYTVTLTATDNDGASASVCQTVTVTVPPVQVITGTMIVTGASSADDINIKLKQSGLINVLFGGVSVGLFSGVHHIIVFAGAGDDDIKLNPGLGADARIYGGDGNDKLVTGAGGDALFGENGNDTLKGCDGADILVGGPGDDALSGGDGNDLLIGGLGADRIMGNANDDILIAGTTLYDSNLAALQSVLAEWNSGRTYSQRVNNIRDGSGSLIRLNGLIFLTPDLTVFDDGARDVLSGDTGTDWFFFNDDAGVKDKITDLASGEFALDLDVLAVM